MKGLGSASKAVGRFLTGALAITIMLGTGGLSRARKRLPPTHRHR